ncbi:hypothetical protein GCM10009730_58930 [Streptomyces albidochromogenes]|uniref:hypothetical protein n=1 Tax=Streptomyces albidochromogenes TaxID=329524 RepID=UPI00110FC9B0|nr:hypothetical protein [Streptomyces albidochromogenes]
MDETTALVSMLQHARVAQMSSVSGVGAYGEIRVDLFDPVESASQDAMAVESLPEFQCMCPGDVRFEVFDRDGERLASRPAPRRDAAACPMARPLRRVSG